MEKVMNTGAQALDDPLLVEEFAFPREAPAAEQLLFLLNYAVLAPSGHNTQPWLFKIVGDEVELYADRTRALAVIDPDDRELIMSCGAALFNLRIALRHYGFTPVVRTFPDPDDPDLLAVVRPGVPLETRLDEHRLFMSIKRRRTNRQPFRKEPVPPQTLLDLQAAVEGEGARLHIFDTPSWKGALAGLIAEGDRQQGRDKSFRRELAAWLHPSRSRHRDGLPGYAQRGGDWRAYAGPLVVRTFDWGKGQAARDRQLAEGSPVLLVLATSADGPDEWLRAGQALERMLLLATDRGLYASYLNQPIEVEALRNQLVDLIGTEDRPQLVLRLGYSDPAPPTPRRAVSEVLAQGP